MNTSRATRTGRDMYDKWKAFHFSVVRSRKLDSYLTNDDRCRVPMKVYYSHCMKTYWTEAERKEMEIIKREFPDVEIVNPPSFEGSSKKQVEGMGFCHRLIDECDILVFSKLLDVITSGVGDEINYALARNKRVFEIKDGCLNPCREPVKYISREQTRRIYRLIEMDPALKRKVTEQ